MESEQHCTNMMCRLFEFSQKENLTDMSIKAGDKTFFVHKCILAAASPTLHNMIQEEFNETKNQIQITLPNVMPTGASHLIEYIYTGEAPINIGSNEESEFAEACAAVGIMLGNSTTEIDQQSTTNTEESLKNYRPTRSENVEELDEISENDINRESISRDGSQVIIQILKPDGIDASDSESETTESENGSSDDEENETFSTDMFDMPLSKRIKLNNNNQPAKPNIIDDVDISALFSVQKRSGVVPIVEPNQLVTCNFSNQPKTFDPSKALKQGRPRLANDYLFSNYPPYICPHESCGKEFETREKCKKHYRTHEERTHVCGTCDKKFLHQKDLITHLRIHTGEKPYKCAECPASFAQNSSLTYHKRTHCDSRPEFVCDQCKQRFKTPKGLQGHFEKIHNGGSAVIRKAKKPHVCPICNERFKLLSGIWQHMKLQHPESEEYKVVAAYQNSRKSVKKASEVRKMPMFQPSYEVHESDGQTILEFTEIKNGDFDGTTYFCTACEQSFEENEYIDHIDNCKGAEFVSCNTCGEFFKTAEERDAHSCNIENKSSNLLEAVAAAVSSMENAEAQHGNNNPIQILNLDMFK